MPWYFPGSDSLKKRACRYLLQRYLGQFLESKLGLDQLTIDLYNGTGCVTNVNLDVDALNEVAEQQSFPIAFVSGSITQISVSIPWSALLSESSFVEITGLHVTVQPKQWKNAGFMFESMFSSMSSSMQLAEECLKQKSLEEEEEIEPQTQTFEGLELFAQAIDAVLARVKVRFIDTVVRLEHVPTHGVAGVALEVHINRLDYFDVAGTDTTVNGEVYHGSAFTVKKFFLEGLSIALGEFSSQQSTLSASISGEGQLKPDEECIPIARLNGRHELSLKIKQNEAVLGPDVEIDVLFGAGLIFLSPRQFHAFVLLMESLTKTATEPNRRTKLNKPMHSSDFRRIELDLQLQLQQAALGGVLQTNVLGRKGWSSENNDDSDDEFQPFSAPNTAHQSDQPEVSRNGMKANGTKNSKPCVDGLAIRRTRFGMKLGSIAMVLLHEDLLSPSATSGGFVTGSSLKHMKQTAEHLFRTVGILNWTQGFPTVIRALNEACPRSHLKFLAAPITIQGHENVSQGCAVQDVVATVGNLDVAEVIVEKVQDKLQFESSPLLRFAQASANSGPHLTLKMTNADSSKRPSPNQTWQVKINLAACESDFDLSVMDRITALSQTHPLFPVLRKSPSVYDSNCTLDRVLEADAISTCVQLSAPELILNIRFPIPDLRPVHELKRIPWWRRCLREDILRLQFFKPVVSVDFKPSDDSHTFHLVCNSAKALYQENRLAEWVPFLWCTAPEGGTVDMSQSAGNLDLPRLSLTLTRADSGAGLSVHQEIDEDSDDSVSYRFGDRSDSMTMSTGEALLKTTQSEPSPFGKKRLIHKGQHLKDDSEIDELVVPGNQRELSEFREEALRRCLCHIEISLPEAEIHLPSKQFYEQIYNRLSTDLCLWEPSAPSYPNVVSPSKLQPPLPPFRPAFSVGSPLTTNSMFMMCKSGIYDSDTDSEEPDSLDTVFQSRFGVVKASSKRSEAPSKLCITLNIGKGTCTASTPIKDVVGYSLTHRGEAQVILQDATLFSVTGFQGNSNLSFLYLQSQKGFLNHQGSIEIDDPLVQISDSGPRTRRLDPVLYPSTAEIGGDQNEPKLTVALKLHVDERYHVKTLKLAVGLRNTTLRHRMQPTSRSWLTQLLEFLDVIDYPVAGYKPPTVVTELHLHLGNCAIDYRPLYLCGRALMTLGTFSLSSNLVAHTCSSLLRFVVEDAALHLSNRVSCGQLQVHKDYVCVVELDLLELWLRTQAAQDSNENTKKKPLVDLQASLHKLNVKTCADSCRLLLELLTYLSNDGDLVDDQVLSEDSSDVGTNHQRPASVLEEKEEDLDDDIDVEAHVHDLMAEAMQDSSPSRATGEYLEEERRQRLTPNSAVKPTEVFFFPDETNVVFKRTAKERENTRMLFKEDEDEKLETKWSDDTLADLLEAAACSEEEEEFCLLENDPGVGVRPRSGEPAIRMLAEGPLRVIENHFSIPLGKRDELKSPRHFPTPLVRYTLRDMSLIWQIYGGHDFPEKGAKKSANKDGDKRVTTVTFSKVDSQRTQCEAGFGPVKQPQESEKGRLLDVLMELQLTKVRFQHELYPEDVTQSSRQVLIIGDVEIRDRLAASGINKFLSMDSSDARPRQSHANMVVIKALHIRPDPTLNAQECSLKVSILPLRLHVDQDALVFLTQFFTDIASGKGEDEEDGNNASPRPVSAAPVMTVASSDGTVKKSSSASSFSSSSPRRTPSENSIQEEIEPAGPPIYFRSFTFAPDVPIRLDYHGKRVDLSQGSLAGLLVGLGQLHCSELTLKRLYYKHGLLGADRLVAYAVNEWLLDIKKHQLPNILGGVGPMHSVVQLIQGVKDLFWLPIEQYQKDGRIVRGLQKGAHAFTTSAALAAIELTSRLVETLQSAAETAYDVVSPGPSVKRHRPWSKGRGKRTRQPVPSDLRDGLAQALQVVREGLGETAHSLVRVASEEAEQKGMTGAVGGVLRQIPSTVVKPIILATEATVSVLGGVQSHLQPDARRQAADKWKLNN